MKIKITDEELYDVNLLSAEARGRIQFMDIYMSADILRTAYEDLNNYVVNLCEKYGITYTITIYITHEGYIVDE